MSPCTLPHPSTLGSTSLLVQPAVQGSICLRFTSSRWMWNDGQGFVLRFSPEITWLDPPTSPPPITLSMGSTLVCLVLSDFNLFHIVKFSSRSQTQPCLSCPVLFPWDPACSFGPGEPLSVHLPFCCFPLACELSVVLPRPTLDPQPYFILSSSRKPSHF